MRKVEDQEDEMTWPVAMSLGHTGPKIEPPGLFCSKEKPHVLNSDASN